MKRIFTIVAAMLFAQWVTTRGADTNAFAAKSSDTTSPRQQAEALIATARQDVEASRFAEAAQAYTKALEILPGWQIDDVAGKDPWTRAGARKTRADLWLKMRRFDKAREEYRASFDYPATDMLDLRSWIHTLIGDSYAAEEKWAEAAQAYQQAVNTGLFGDRRYDVPPKLKRAKRLAEAHLVAMPTVQKEGIRLKVERSLGGQLPVGFYIYLYNWKQNQNPAEHDLDDALAEMARRGFNYLYVGGVAGDNAMWQKLLESCERLHIVVVPQLEFGYMQPQSDIAALVSRVVPFIRKYKDHPAVLAFSVREEPFNVELTRKLQEYYEGILQKVPDAPLHLVHCYLDPLKAMEPPYPVIIGTDRYPFWWEFGSGGHRATPAYALNWFRSQMDAYYQETVDRGAEFQAVFTADTLESFATPETVRQSFYPDMPDAQRAKYLANAELNAQNKNLGWDQGPHGLLRYWKYYRPPANCVRAMSWLSVLEGARSVAIWHWSPLDASMKDFAHRQTGRPGKEYICSITGWDGKGTPQLDEFTAFAGEIRRYGKLIRSMTKEKNTEAQPITIQDEHARWRSFRVNGYAGRVIVVVNTQVGQWCDGRSPGFLSPQDVYRIDERGELIGYKPFTQPREIKLRLTTNGLNCVDLRQSNPLPVGADGTLSIFIPPGGGQFLFLSPTGGTELIQLRQQFLK